MNIPIAILLIFFASIILFAQLSATKHFFSNSGNATTIGFQTFLFLGALVFVGFLFFWYAY